MTARRPSRAELERDYDLVRGCLRPDYARLADAVYIRRDPDTFEITWPSSSLEDDLKRMGLF